MSHHVVIIGAGFAGLAACKPLEALARNRKDVSVTLLDSRSHTTMVPALPDLAGGRYESRYLTEPIGEMIGDSVVYGTGAIHIAAVEEVRRNVAVREFERTFPFSPDGTLVTTWSQYTHKELRECALTLENHSTMQYKRFGNTGMQVSQGEHDG